MDYLKSYDYSREFEIRLDEEEKKYFSNIDEEEYKACENEYFQKLIAGADSNEDYEILRLEARQMAQDEYREEFIHNILPDLKIAIAEEMLLE